MTTPDQNTQKEIFIKSLKTAFKDYKDSLTTTQKEKSDYPQTIKNIDSFFERLDPASENPIDIIIALTTNDYKLPYISVAATTPQGTKGFNEQQTMLGKTRTEFSENKAELIQNGVLKKLNIPSDSFKEKCTIFVAIQPELFSTRSYLLENSQTFFNLSQYFSH